MMHYAGVIKKLTAKQRLELHHPGIAYEPFLFASLGDDGNGAPLAMASILGRMKLDPWSEAALLAAMPAEAAATRIASLIEAVPRQSAKLTDFAALAAGLVKLLPARATPAAPITAITDATFSGDAIKMSRPISYLTWLAIFCILLLGATFV